MSLPQVEIQMIAMVAAAACALPGVFLVLRRMAMMSDAISHTVLLGIVVAFFITGSLASPLLIIGAALTGLLTVSLVELVGRTRLVREDAAIGLVFPALFSLAVILISRFAGDIHLDTDAVLLGELAFAPFERLTPFGIDIGPVSLYLMLGVFLINLTFLLLFYKELKLSTFDAGLATALGFTPWLLHYALMGLVSLTAVAAFDTVGSILVVAMMIAPPATAYLLTDKLPLMIVFSVLIGAVSALTGYWLAHWLDASISGSMAVMMGITFALALLFAPQRGLVARSLRQRRQRWEFAQTMLVVHLFNHSGLAEESAEYNPVHLQDHMRWTPEFARQVLRQVEHKGLVTIDQDSLKLTSLGQQQAVKSLNQ
jgi:manganese/zinc/iron transport system permease protein